MLLRSLPPLYPLPTGLILATDPCLSKELRSTDIPGAEGRGRSEGIEPPWKSFKVITARCNFFFDIFTSPDSLSLSLGPSLSLSIDREVFIRKLDEGKSTRNRRREKQTENTRGGEHTLTNQGNSRHCHCRLLFRKKTLKISLLEFRSANHQTLAVVTAKPNEWPQQPRSSIKA
jgi:hypothetical protein